MDECRNNESCRNTWIGLLVGFSAGALVGAVTALLLAPASGVETREKIKSRAGEISEKAGEYVEKSKGFYEETRGKVTNAYGTAKEKTAEAFDSAKEKFANRGKKEDDPAV